MSLVSIGLLDVSFGTVAEVVLELGVVSEELVTPGPVVTDGPGPVIVAVVPGEGEDVSPTEVVPGTTAELELGWLDIPDVVGVAGGVPDVFETVGETPPIHSSPVLPTDEQ